MASATNVPIQGTRMLSSSALSQVLQSEPVRRLFNQPNIVIHAIPRNNSPTAFRMIKPKSSIDKKNIVNGEYQLPDKPDVSIQIISMPNNETSEVENLLPSKNNGKSEILLVPIIRKRKDCGHFEPCESLVCNVTVQEYEDDEGITPLISINIEEDEIDASITKHCKNDKCDALSIDHDRCRRASIQLYRCDKCIKCDICGNTFKTRKARLNHKKCRRKNMYQYNTASPSSIFKYRMRERELQILEAAKAKRSCDYLDPIMGFNRTMETLTKNDELIIIPKMPPQFKPSKPCFPSININLSNSNNSNNSNNINNINNINNNNNNNNNNSNNNMNNNFNYNKNNNNTNLKSILGNKKLQTPCTDRELTSEMISSIILSCQNSISNNRNEHNSSLPSKHIKLSDHFNGGTVNVMDTPSSQDHQYINIASLSSNNVNSTSITEQHQLTTNSESPLNNKIMNSKQQIEKITEPPTNNITEPIQELNINKWMMPNEPYPFKVVPIAELKSEPSLLHQTHGVPKFCVVADTSAMPQFTSKVKRPFQKENSNQKEKHSVLSALPKLIPKVGQVLNPGKFRPLQPALSGTTDNIDVKLDGTVLSKKQKTRKRSRKKLLKKGKFRCTHCSKRFSSIDYCRLHIAKHENNPGFFCRLCEKGFINKYVMKKHLDTDHKIGEVRCEMCNKVLSSLQDLLKHMKYPETKVKQQCSECSEIFDLCSSLDIHMRKKHGFLICTLCKRQVTNIKMKRHLMLEHSISKNRSETGFDKLTYLPGENDKVCEINLISEIALEGESNVKTELVSENKVEMDCIARSRSVRRRSSKEFFICSVCDRRFENEKQFQIHLANNPMKFTLCPDCGRKFHRKSQYTEHSKTCSQNTKIIEQAIKRKKSDPLNNEFVSKDVDIRSQNSIDQKLNETLKPSICKKLKLNQEKIVQKDEKEDRSNLKNTVTKIKIVNGLKQDSSDCLEMLKVIKLKNNVQMNKNYVRKNDDKEVLLLNMKHTHMNSDKSAVLDKLIAVTHIIQDHNYQALQ